MYLGLISLVQTYILCVRSHSELRHRLLGVGNGEQAARKGRGGRREQIKIYVTAEQSGRLVRMRA